MLMEGGGIKSWLSAIIFRNIFTVSVDNLKSPSYTKRLESSKKKKNSKITGCSTKKKGTDGGTKD